MEFGSLRVVTCLLIFASLMFASPVANAQGLLSGIQEEVRTPSAPKKSSNDQPNAHRKKRKRCGHSYACTCDDDDQSFFAWVFWGAATAPFWVPPKALEDDYSLPGYFPEYPYQDGIPGYMMIDPELPIKPFAYSLQAGTEYAGDFDSISRIGTHFLVDTTTRFGIDSEVNYWRESLGGRQYDDVWTGDANLVFRFAQSERLQMRTGLGTNWIANDVGSDFGFNFTYQGDFFIHKPWVISGELDLGSLGDETLVHGRITTGLQWRRVEMLIGYDYYEVGQTKLNGFVSGIRLWF